MPTYEYRCEKCEQTFEAFQPMKDEAFKVCPQKLCRQDIWGQGKVKRLIGTGAGLLFKGSGFYITDYRSSGYKESAKKEGHSSSSDTAKGGGDAAKGGGDAAKGGGDAAKGGGDAAKGGGDAAKGGGDKTAPSSGKPSTST